MTTLGDIVGQWSLGVAGAVAFCFGLSSGGIARIPLILIGAALMMLFAPFRRIVRLKVGGVEITLDKPDIVAGAESADSAEKQCAECPRLESNQEPSD